MEHGFMILNFITEPLSEFMQKIMDAFAKSHPGVPAGLLSSPTSHTINLNHVTYMWLYMLVLIVLAILVAKKIDMVPGKLQNFVEVVIDGLKNLVTNTMGPEGLRFFPLLATLALFILISNLAGLIPGFYSPTASLNTNAAMALTVFCLTHIVGVKEHGPGYIKHFLGPVWWLAPIMLPIEIISHLVRPLSLTMRLFGNIAGEDLVLVVLLMLVPLLVPSVMMFLMIFTAVLQAFVFTLLTMMYIGGALAEAH